jgi:hypothetical protein
LITFQPESSGGSKRGKCAKTSSAAGRDSGHHQKTPSQKGVKDRKAVSLAAPPLLQDFWT